MRAWCSRTPDELGPWVGRAVERGRRLMVSVCVCGGDDGEIVKSEGGWLDCAWW